MDTPLEASGAAEEFACHDCAQVQTLPPLGLRALARCLRCDAVLDRREPPDSTPLALALAGLFCGLVANAFPNVKSESLRSSFAAATTTRRRGESTRPPSSVSSGKRELPMGIEDGSVLPLHPTIATAAIATAVNLRHEFIVLAV